MLAVDPEKIIFQKLAPSQENIRVQAFAFIHLGDGWHGTVHKTADTAVIQTTFFHRLPDEMTDMDILKIETDLF